MPVDGPARWMSVTTSGSSTASARPTVSALRFIPGPLVVVMAIDPPKAAPSAAPMPAISSSAWNVKTSNCFNPESSWSTSLAGVIG